MHFTPWRLIGGEENETSPIDPITIGLTPNTIHSFFLSEKTNLFLHFKCTESHFAYRKLAGAS